MAALLAYGVTVAVLIVASLLDLLTEGYISRLLFRPIPFIPAIPPVAGTLAWLIGTYVAASVLCDRLVRAAYALVDAGNPPLWARWITGLDREVRTDYGDWSAGIAIVVLVIAAVTLPFISMDGLHPGMWGAAALFGGTVLRTHALRSRWRQASTRAPERTGVAAGTPIGGGIAPQELLRRLLESPRYRGQLRAWRSYGAVEPGDAGRGAASDIPPEIAILDGVLRSIGIDGVAGLHRHQRQALMRLLRPTHTAGDSPPHVVLSTGPGSGRDLVTFLAAFDRTLHRAGHVLIVAPDDASAARYHAAYALISERTAWRYAISDAALSADWSRDIPDPPPEILFASLDSVNRHLLGDVPGWSEFFDALELVIARDIDKYVGIFGANAGQVFRRVRGASLQRGRTLTFLATSAPATNLAPFATELFGLGPADDAFEVVSQDSAPRPAHIVAAWTPSLDVDREHGTPVTRTLRRQSLADASVELCAAMVEVGAAVVVFDPTDAMAVARRLVEQVSRRVGRELSQDELRYVAAADDLGPVLRGADALIVVGAPWSADDLRHYAGRLGARRNGGVVVGLDRQSPAMRSLIVDLVRSRQPVAGRLLPLFAEHGPIAARHFDLALEEGSVSPESARRLFGDLGERWSGARPGDSERGATSQVSTARDLPLTIVGRPDGQINVTNAIGDTVLVADRGREPYELFEGRLITVNGRPLVVQRTQAGYRAHPPAAGRAAHSVPLYRTRVAQGATNRPPIALRLAGGNPIAVRAGSCEITQTLVAVREVDDEYPVDSWTVRPVTEESTSLVTDAVVIGLGAASGRGTKLAHSLAHSLHLVLRGVLPPAFAETQLQVAVDSDGETTQVAVFDSVEGDIGVAELAEQDFASVLQSAFALTSACPCRTGCPACLVDRNCRIWADAGCGAMLDKRAVLEFLGEGLGRMVTRLSGSPLEDLLTSRYDAVTHVDRLRKLQEETVAFGLQPLVGSDLADYHPAPVRFMDVAERSDNQLMGLFMAKGIGEREIAVAPASEETLVEVLAHETAHDAHYVLRGGSPVVGGAGDGVDPVLERLVQEGFAQWMELRIVDGFGFRQDFDEITFRIFDEYGEGFQLIKAIEDESGVDGVLSAMRDGIPINRLMTIVRRTGMESRILDLQRLVRDAQAELPGPDVSIAVPEARQPTEQPVLDEAKAGKPAGETDAESVSTRTRTRASGRRSARRPSNRSRSSDPPAS